MRTNRSPESLGAHVVASEWVVKDEHALPLSTQQGTEAMLSVFAAASVAQLGDLAAVVHLSDTADPGLDALAMAALMQMLAACMHTSVMVAVIAAFQVLAAVACLSASAAVQLSAGVLCCVPMLCWPAVLCWQNAVQLFAAVLRCLAVPCCLGAAAIAETVVAVPDCP